ncbi:TetR/AcrR family transcriptional regulator [Streptomyces hydrogenans]|uniref:TetR/AcrR family transcriptional regulator n=1 Tax=Streptomyces hydrogenans TaxID=1873719 RepID=UPI0033BB78CA
MFEKKSKTQVTARPAAVQRRGVERRKAILDAAEALLAEQGYASATLKAVGERAGIPVASMYHYFSDRHEVDAELLQRHMAALDAALAASLERPGADTLAGAVDSVIDPFLAYFRAHPGCAELWFNGRAEAIDESVRAFDEEQAERLWRALVERGRIRPDTPVLVLRIAFEAGGRLFDLAFRRSPGGDDESMAEARRLLTAYLATYAPGE